MLRTPKKGRNNMPGLSVGNLLTYIRFLVETSCRAGVLDSKRETNFHSKQPKSMKQTSVYTVSRDSSDVLTFS